MVNLKCAMQFGIEILLNFENNKNKYKVMNIDDI